MLDHAGSLDVDWSHVWKLDPVLEKTFVYPVNQSVDAFTTLFLGPVSTLFFSSIKNSLDNPVISLHSENLSPESES